MIGKNLKFPKPVFREWDGVLTSELVRTPGRFGLGQVPSNQAPEAVVGSVCGFCSTGCNLRLHLQQGSAVNLTPDPAYPVNLGMACPKGWEALTPLEATDRGTTPLVRSEGSMVPIPWPQALSEFTTRMRAVQDRHGLAAAAFISTGQIVCEEMAFLGALAKFGMGMVHGDGNTRQCMATAVTAYKQSFGFDAPPYTYADFEESDVLVFVGANPCIAHPIMWQRVMRNRRNPEIVVIDPRRTETACAATLHAAARPKSDLTLFYGLAREAFVEGAVNRSAVAEYLHGIEEYEKFTRNFEAKRVLAETGLDASTYERLVSLINSGQRVSFWWTMGVNQSHQATRTAQAIINLALITGNIGKPGTGANSITGQCNAMGSRLFSNTTNLLGGHEFTDPGDREKIAGILGINASRIPAQKSLAYDQILESVERGEIRALWIIATNPAHSWIHQNRFHALREKLEFLVVQDMYPTTETARSADLYLPAAGWGEKEGTFINSERRIGVVRSVHQPPGQALSDFRIFRAIAEAWGCGDMFKSWTSPEAVFQILKRCSAGQPCEITGIRDYAHLETEGGIQWPFAGREGTQQSANCEPGSEVVKERRLFEALHFYHPDGKAKLWFDPPEPAAELPDSDYPFWLLTGRGSSSQWHTGSRTEKSAILRKLHPADPIVELHPADGARLGIEDGARILVLSRRGEVVARAVLTPSVPQGHVFIPMHDAQTNQLTVWSVDPHSRQPSYKSGAVRLSPLNSKRKSLSTPERDC
ncbi:MAG: molybdopterin oxidoreductase family protein [Puniceicoccaceae bacterium]